MAFHNVILPTDISFGSGGGPTRRTEVAILGSGYEERNAIWANSRRKYNAGYALRKLGDKDQDQTSINNIFKIIAFFEARNARLHSFKFKDWSDYKSCSPLNDISATDQQIGVGDGTTADFQLVKVYGDTAATWTRTIVLPRTGNILVAVDGVVKTKDVDFAVGALNGIISFAAAPLEGAVITAGFEFYVPVRFDTDELKINLAAWEAGEVPDVPLIEVRLTP
jgi:uncharacterized protein (TIGR02217 family)